MGSALTHICLTLVAPADLLVGGSSALGLGGQKEPSPEILTWDRWCPVQHRAYPPDFVSLRSSKSSWGERS